MPDDLDEELLIEELEMSGVDVTGCLETGCSVQMLYNGACDEDCNNLECEYDMGFCFKFFDYHGYKAVHPFLADPVVPPCRVTHALLLHRRYGWDFEVR